MEKDLEGDQELLSSEIMSSTNIGALESYGQQLADRSIGLSRCIDDFLSQFHCMQSNIGNKRL